MESEFRAGFVEQVDLIRLAAALKYHTLHNYNDSITPVMAHVTLLANCHRQAKLTLCRRLLGQSANALVTNAIVLGAAGTLEPDRKVARIEPGDACPVCQQGRMQLVETYYRHRAAGDLSVAVPVLDTS
jgi:hypothetical protein